MTSAANRSAATDRIGWPTWRLAGVIVLGAFLSMLDGSIVTVGLDTIGHDLQVGLDDVQWVTSAYLLALAVSLPVCGWLGRRIGVGRLWLASLAGFTLTSALCALAPTQGWLIALRVAQGLAAGLMVPAGQTILGQAVGPARLGQVMAVLGIAVSFGPAIGPALGGVLIATWSWPWLFLVNIPVGALGLLAGWKLIPRGIPEQPGPFDWTGMALVSIGLPMFVYAATAWGERGTLTAPTVLIPLLLGLGGLAGFALHTLRRRHPLTNLRLLSNPIYTAGAISAAFTGAAMFSALLLLPLFFQLLRGASIIDTGLSLISYGIGTALILPLAGRLTDRYGGGIIASVGAAVTIVTTVPFAVLDPDAGPLLVQTLLILRGAAIGLAAVPPTVAAYAAVDPNQLPDATTQLNILQRVGGAVGAALIAVILASALPAGAPAAFALAFWWLTAASGLALMSSLWLWRAQHRCR